MSGTLRGPVGPSSRGMVGCILFSRTSNPSRRSLARSIPVPCRRNTERRRVLWSYWVRSSLTILSSFIIDELHWD